MFLWIYCNVGWQSVDCIVYKGRLSICNIKLLNKATIA